MEVNAIVDSLFPNAAVKDCLCSLNRIRKRLAQGPGPNLKTDIQIRSAHQINAGCFRLAFAKAIAIIDRRLDIIPTGHGGRGLQEITGLHIRKARCG